MGVVWGVEAQVQRQRPVVIDTATHPKLCVNRPGPLGVDGVSKSEVSRICSALDTAVAAFRTRVLYGEHRYLWVDATYHKERVDGRVISQLSQSAVDCRWCAAAHRRQRSQAAAFQIG
jgi:hypothetical protein